MLKDKLPQALCKADSSINDNSFEGSRPSDRRSRHGLHLPRGMCAIHYVIGMSVGKLGRDQRAKSTVQSIYTTSARK
jgi:hypothetical protein